MWMDNLGGIGGSSFTCVVCGRNVEGVGDALGVCADCLRGRWAESRIKIANVHADSRRRFGLPVVPPRRENGLHCALCPQHCRMAPGDLGYCGVRTGDADSFRRDGRQRALVSWYYDPLPTNCVADWVCPGGTGAGFPLYARERGPEVGYYNLAVFFESCNFNCLFCQNWMFKRSSRLDGPWRSLTDLLQAVDDRTSCLCFFGGDPIPQLPFAIRIAQQIRRRRPNRKVRICWETNAATHPGWVRTMARISLESGGCVKVDLKAWDSGIHEALCGFPNQQVLENFELLARLAAIRPEPPPLIASTLLVPGYVGIEEVARLAAFIARLNPDIPYALLGFAPQFLLEGSPTTSRQEAETCLDAAIQAGLRRVRLANRHLLH
jgi:pyruvate formate lyase activating enzyme